MLELRVRWGDQPLHVAHLAPEREVWVGDDTEGPVTYALPITRTRVAPGTTTAGPFTIEAELCSLDRVPKGWAFSGDWLAAWVLTALIHALALGAISTHPPTSFSVDEEQDRAYVAKLIEHAKLHDSRSANIFLPPSASGNDLGAAHHGPNGALGRSTARTSNAHFALEGETETTEAKLARARALIEDGKYAPIGALAAALEGRKGPFAGDHEDNVGTDARSVVGNMFGSTAGESYGPNGLGLSGTGSGGANKWSGIGIGDVGIFGACGCLGGMGLGSSLGTGRLGLGELRKKPARIVEIPTGNEIHGALPPETIKRVIRANFPRFRQCYERGLKSNPSLSGTVAVRFIIDATGAIESATSAGGTLDDNDVHACVLGVYRSLSFPEPEHGKVMVTYPIDFQPE